MSRSRLNRSMRRYAASSLFSTTRRTSVVHQPADQRPLAGEKQPAKEEEGRGRGVPRAAAGPGVPGGPGRPGSRSPGCEARTRARSRSRPTRRYGALRDSGERMLELLLAGLSTRSYGKAVGEMAETAGVSKSSVSRQAAEAAGERLKELAEGRLDDREYLIKIIYVDGIQFGGHHVLAAFSVDDMGYKDLWMLKARTWTNSALPLLTERRLPRRMNRSGAPPHRNLQLRLGQHRPESSGLPTLYTPTITYCLAGKHRIRVWYRAAQGDQAAERSTAMLAATQAPRRGRAWRS